MDCSNQRELCQKMGYLNDLIYFRVGEVQQGKGIVSVSDDGDDDDNNNNH